MLMVLVHLYGALFPPGLRRLCVQQQLHPSTRLPSLFLYFLAVVIFIPVATAQGASNGQLQTDGISVIAAPAPNAVLHPGSTTGIAIDVNAANGSPGFVYNSLEVYLVSAVENINVTISSGPQLLAQEPGSTVKHINWRVAECLNSGSYNLTIYEASSLNNTGYYAIMVVPVRVENDLPPERRTDCSSISNVAQPQPQPDSPPPVELIPGRTGSSSSSAPASTTTSTTTSSSTSTTTSSTSTTTAPSSSEVITITASNGEITIPLTELPGTIVVEPPGGAPNATATTSTSSGFITVTKTVAPTATATLTQVITQSMTVTFEETFTSTFTAPGETIASTTTVTSTIVSTIHLVQTQVSGSDPRQAGFLPVSAAFRTLRLPLLGTMLCCTLLTSVLRSVLRLSFAL